MNRRWAVLFWSALGTLIGAAWFAQRWDVGIWVFLNAQLIGVMVSAGAAFGAMKRDVWSKAPAVVALLGAAPLALKLWRFVSLPDLPELVQLGGPGLGLMVVGGAATVVAALGILLRPLPPRPAPPPVAPARVVT